MVAGYSVHPPSQPATPAVPADREPCGTAALQASITSDI